MVAIYNLVDDEDIEDDDDLAEIERDLWEMAATFGAVRSVEVPRDAARSDSDVGEGLTAATVAFASAEEAQHAKRGFHGRVVGGKTLRVEIENADNLSDDDTSASGGGGGGTGAPGVWRVAVENLIDEEDDLGDEDEYAELCADISAMLGVHGTLVEVDIPRARLGESEKGADDGRPNNCPASTAAAADYAVVVAYGSQAEAEACVKDTNGRRVGGKELKATLILRQPRVGSESAGRTNRRPRDDASAISRAAGCRSAVSRAGAAPATPPSADTITATGGGGATCTGAWRVVIRNLIDEDDLVDDDDYGEVCSDTTALVSAYGAVTRICIPRDRMAAGEKEADTRDGAEPGEAVAVFGSAEEAGACARGLSGRKIAGKILDALVTKEQPPSQPGVETRAEAGPGNGGPPLRQQPPGGTLTQSGRSSVAPDLQGSGTGVVRGVEPQTGAAAAAAAGTGAQPSAGVATPASIEGGKRMPTKYKEAAALPKPPGIGNGSSRNAYVNQVRLGNQSCRCGVGPRLGMVSGDDEVFLSETRAKVLYLAVIFSLLN